MKKQKIKTIKDMIKEKKEEKELKDKYKIKDENTVVILKKNIFLQILNFLEKTIIKLLKLIFVLVVAILSTIGLTVLINEPLRIQLINMLTNNLF